MKRISNRLLRALVPGGLLLVLLLAGGPAVAVTVTIGTASGQVGDTVALPLTVTGLVEDIRAYEIEVTWYQNRAQCVGINTAGTLSAGWSVTEQINTSSVSIVGASAAPLVGDGVLLEILFELGPNSGGSAVNFGAVLFNEGDPVPVLVNGSLSVSALPTINISPDSGLMAVGESLQFSTTGGTGPYSYTSSDPAVADFTGDWLTGLAPGFVQATSEDTGLITDTTTGQIEVRAFNLIAGSVPATSGQEVLIPVTLDDPAGYGIVSAEVALTWYAPYATFTGIETAGTIAAAAGWTAPLVTPGAGEVSVVMAGATPLTGTGVLFYLKLVPSGSFYVYVGDQVFNEVYPAVPNNGYVTTTPGPTIGITPSSGSLLVGDQLQFSTTGTPTPPFVWSTSDPLVASISPTGKLLALGEGTVQVQVVDDLGAVAQSGNINICSLGMPAISSSISASETVLVPVTVSRSLDDLDIYSYEISVNYSSAYVTFGGAVVSGSITAGWGSPTVVDNGSSVSIYHAGAMPLTGCAPALIYLEFVGLPSLVSPYSGVSLTSALFNEGVPCARLNSGATCENLSAVPRAESGLRLWPNHPNPFNPSTTIRYSLERDGTVELVIYSARGARVRTLVTGWQTAGSTYTVVWDGRDDQGRVQSSGVYYTRLRSDEDSALQKMVLLK